MSNSINKILEVFIDGNQCFVTADIEDMVQVRPASSWSDPPEPAEFCSATCMGRFSIDDHVLPSNFYGPEMELLCESIDMDWEVASYATIDD
tara:strand:+ start:202 stop:477 length:276 start_codon:yes stop_codon:yes gene_type:complete